MIIINHFATFVIQKLFRNRKHYSAIQIMYPCTWFLPNLINHLYYTGCYKKQLEKLKLSFDLFCRSKTGVFYWNWVQLVEKLKNVFLKAFLLPFYSNVHLSVNKNKLLTTIIFCISLTHIYSLHQTNFYESILYFSLFQEHLKTLQLK